LSAEETFANYVPARKTSQFDHHHHAPVILVSAYFIPKRPLEAMRRILTSLLM